jgi:plasmid stabilization system protein ParE
MGRIESVSRAVSNLSLHPLVQRDIREALAYYERVGGEKLADRFFAEAESIVNSVWKNPLAFPPIDDFRRRLNFRDFPYHFIYETGIAGTRITVLRHHKRNPQFGSRKR